MREFPPQKKIEYELVTDSGLFRNLMETLSKLSIVAVDLEGEWNMHRFGLHLCLIQVSDGERIWLVDPLSVGDLKPFLELWRNPAVKKISHGPQSDIILLNYRHEAVPANIFDTERAAQFLAYEATSLSGLLEAQFGISKNMKVRASNWNTRPLTDQMMAYAAMDVAYLHDLHEILVRELSQKGRLAWQEEENRMLETIRYKKKEAPHLELPGASKLEARQVMILRGIFETRDKMAAMLDKPAYHILANPKLLELAIDPPGSVREWEQIAGAHPRLRQFAPEFHAAVSQALEAPLEPLPDRRTPRLPAFAGLSKTAYFKKVDKRLALLEKIQEVVDGKFEVPKLILSSRIVKRVGYGEGSLSELREWQQAILAECAKEAGVDLALLGDA